MKNWFIKISCAVIVVLFSAMAVASAYAASDENPVSKFFRRLFGWPVKTTEEAGKTVVGTTVQAGKTGVKTVEDIVVDPGTGRVENEERVFECVQHLVADKFKILGVPLGYGSSSIAIDTQHGIADETHGICVNLTRPFIADNFSNVPLVRVNHVPKMTLGNEEIIPVRVIPYGKRLPGIKHAVIHGEPDVIG